MENPKKQLRHEYEQAPHCSLTFFPTQAAWKWLPLSEDEKVNVEKISAITQASTSLPVLILASVVPASRDHEVILAPVEVAGGQTEAQLIPAAATVDSLRGGVHW